MNEIWKKVPGYGGRFEASSLGRIRTVDRQIVVRQHSRKGKPLNGWTKFSPGKILDLHINSIGYVTVSIGNKKQGLAHRLIADAFFPPDPSRGQINHINGIRSDNRIENLERCTPGENQRHRYEVLKQKGTCIGKFSKEHPSSKPVSAVRLGNGDRFEFDCGLDAIRAGIAKDSGSITRCCQGKIRHHNGFVWSYA